MLIGFTGYKRSGKDLSAKAVRRVEPTTQSRAFASALRVEAHEAFSVPFSIFADDSVKEKPHVDLAIMRTSNTEFYRLMRDAGIDVRRSRTPREILQLYGTEYRRRHYGADYWIKPLFDWFDLHPGAVQCVTDVRFPNEAAAILNRGGQIWKLIRPGLRASDTHKSEAFIDLIAPNRVIFNDGSVEELTIKVQNHFKQYRDERA